MPNFPRPAILALLLSACTANPAPKTLTLAYNDFGPQALAYETLGMQWPQWQSHGDDRDNDPPIDIIVYTNTDRATVQKQFPIDPARNRDRRYLPLNTAIAYLEKNIDAQQSESTPDPTVLEPLQRTRERLRRTFNK
jgi:hypothetical protein